MTMSLSERRRLGNRLKGAAFCVAGLALCATSGAGLFQFRAASAALASQLATLSSSGAAGADFAACEAALRRAGASEVVHTARSARATLAVTSDTLPEVEAAVHRLSVAVMRCGYPVKSFCAGPACEAPGLTIELTVPKSESEKRPPPAAPGR